MEEWRTREGARGVVRYSPWMSREERQGEDRALGRGVPVPNARGLAEQGVHAARNHQVGPEISRVGTSHERRRRSWEVQGQKYYMYYCFVVCKPFDSHCTGEAEKYPWSWRGRTRCPVTYWDRDLRVPAARVA